MTDPEIITSPPLLRIVRGTPTTMELAALVAVVASRSGSADEPVPAAPSRWASPEARLRRQLTPGQGAWAASAWH